MMAAASVGAVARRAAIGALSGAVGTAAMDLLLYWRHRKEGGTEQAWRWESAAGTTSWDQASAPGQLGQKLERFVTGQPPPDRWARSTTNAMHWATGCAWGLQYGLVAGLAPKRQWLLTLGLGPLAWLTSYVVLPLAKVYKPIWEYDARTLRQDLSAHLVFGTTTGVAYAVLRRLAGP